MPKRLLIDANLLLFLLAGMADKTIISRHKRLKRFQSHHFSMLAEIMAPYDGLVVTPHCLAELWNLIGEQRGAWDEHREALLSAAHQFVGSAIEVYHPAKDLVQRDEIGWLGLADVSQLCAALEGGFALTSADGLLCRQASALGIETHHFWQLAEG